MLIEDALYANWRERTDNPKPIALGTPLRYSAAGNCSRALGYMARGDDLSDPMDVAGVTITDIGTMRHDQMQDEVMALDPTVEIEVASQVGVWSGSADIVYFTGTKPESIDELKTVGSYKRDKLWGIKGYRRQSADEPSRANVLQLGLQMTGLEVDHGRLVYLPNEPFSKGVAEALNLSDMERVVKVFHVELDAIYDDVQDEVRRGEEIVEFVQQGSLPPREWEDEAGRWVEPNPESTAFPCQYCPYRTACIKEGR